VATASRRRLGSVGRVLFASDPWLAAILALSLVLNAFHLGWGLPNGNASWAADSYGPITVLGLVLRSFHRWNSGFFYFKYPLGYPFLLAATFAPYLAFAYLTGTWKHPATTYPYGFADPERSLYVLMLCGRLLSVAFGVGVARVAYAIGDRLFDRSAARWSALLTATAYPIVYYSHTTNLDIGYAFWLLLALACAVFASADDRPLPWAWLGIAAAMALSTKEQGFAFLLPLPFLCLGARIRRHGVVGGVFSRPVAVMVLATLVSLVLANNILFNPLGFVARIAYLLGHPLRPVTARLAPVEFALWKGAKEWTYVRQLWDAIDSALGTALACVSAAAVAAMLLRPRAALWLLLPAVSYYYLSLRAMELITLRYTLPLIVCAAIAAGGLISLLRNARLPALQIGATVLGVLLGILAVGRAAELDWLLWTDSRYQAEAWMQFHLPSGARGEVYQKSVYVPRFHDDFAVEEISIQDRSIEALRRRAPQFIVISSASHKSISHIWNPDWRTTRQLLTPVPQAVQMVHALESGSLGYSVAARFRQTPRLLRLRITSIAPEITIYERERD
jgi:Dolichyl-phosphate-mannose-protein mannosyltransferase